MQEQLVIWFGETGATAARYVIAFAVVLLLLVALRWIVRRYMGGPSIGGARGRQPRLAVMDVAVVDARRRLVLVRRDNVEHLVMIGGPSDIVIEQTIVRGMPVGTMGRLAPRQAAPPEPAAQPAEADQPSSASSPRQAIPRAAETTAAARPYQEQPVRPAAPA
ncbi:MAG TPA: flagellar biosynthesis protein FliO, partial [Methylomirabilota bacterium]|nr:flagellar biosynthesis protein FliO [Methylomirabilota bacterium]